MMKPNLSKIGKWAKNNKGGIIGLLGLIVTEIGFMSQGFNDGVERGAIHGANYGVDYVLNKAKSMGDGTFEKLKNELVKDGCKFKD